MVWRVAASRLARLWTWSMARRSLFIAPGSWPFRLWDLSGIGEPLGSFFVGFGPCKDGAILIGGVQGIAQKLRGFDVAGGQAIKTIFLSLDAFGDGGGHGGDFVEPGLDGITEAFDAGSVAVGTNGGGAGESGDFLVARGGGAGELLDFFVLAAESICEVDQARFMFAKDRGGG